MASDWQEHYKQKTQSFEYPPFYFTFVKKWICKKSYNEITLKRVFDGISNTLNSITLQAMDESNDFSNSIPIFVYKYIFDLLRFLKSENLSLNWYGSLCLRNTYKIFKGTFYTNKFLREHSTQIS